MYQVSIIKVLQKRHNTQNTSAHIKLFCAYALNQEKHHF